ncbi:MAG TPA: M48 family metalloprotease, partial [Phenylobacterium sp.]|nr:M48 family metalloprotease [Phenylobacterium sp.]
MRAGLLAAVAVASLAVGSAAQAQRLAGVRPDLASDEGGLWSVSDKAEIGARQSAELDRDPALNAYVRDVACKVARDHCADIRVYVMDRPFFNASMAPNGYTEVWSGTLLRAADEAQLAFILGHEISHFDRNHSLTSWRRRKSTANAMMVLSAGVAVVGVAAASSAHTYDGASSIMDATRGLIDVVYLAGMASLFGFDRANELEADRLGLGRA